ncbi:hypothetical protein MMC12_001458 [Toensbergia leucococca]|nr:hypothetical protein [Toensbergia leucococca]
MEVSPTPTFPAWSRWSMDRTTTPPSQILRIRPSLSNFELLITGHPPILESLLLQLPTSAILDLYHTSTYLQSFLRFYPIAWNYLSFRLFNPGHSNGRQASPGSDTSGDFPPRRSKQYALDKLLLTVVVPCGSRLTSLDLDNTAVSGLVLTSIILPSGRETLKHLSIRGCKYVSLKYHIVPYLTVFSLQKAVSSLNRSQHVDKLALRSLYTFRCRHHRRRPYLTASLLRGDSDAEPTHELIKACYNLGIWTDTAWCPTPGGRCLRRKDYYAGRGNLDGRGEVWVVFDRLWRSGNKLGSSAVKDPRPETSTGQLWKEAEYGHEGEPLGCEQQLGHGEGKIMPTHLRRSHRIFIENFVCHACGDKIPERCEQCSVRMHCMGCRKTLCASCAFSRPLPSKKARPSSLADTGNNERDGPHDREHQHFFWWAPGETRSPNMMTQELADGDVIATNHAIAGNPPVLKMQWCCLKPMFSGDGGISFVGPGMSGEGARQVRTAPLPRGRGWEDPEFARIRQDEDFPRGAYGKPEAPDYTLRGGHDQMLHWLLYGPGSQENSPCPRSLCQECRQTPGWQAACQACREPFCFAHDLRGLKMRICGYRDLMIEKKLMKQRSAKAAQSAMAQILLLNNPDKELLEAIRNRLNSIRTRLARTGTLPNHNPITRELALLAGVPEPDETDHEIDTSNTTSHGRPFFSLSQGHDSRELFFDDVAPSLTDSDGTVTVNPDLSFFWRGCASFMCPEYRSIGDHRPKCTADAKECSLCGVHVCPDCLQQNTACECSYCKSHYRCPKCYGKLAPNVCKRAEEDKQKQELAEAAEAERRTLADLTERADEMAGTLGEFFANLEVVDESGNDGVAL